MVLLLKRYYHHSLMSKGRYKHCIFLKAPYFGKGNLPQQVKTITNLISVTSKCYPAKCLGMINRSLNLHQLQFCLKKKEHQIWRLNFKHYRYEKSLVVLLIMIFNGRTMNQNNDAILKFNLCYVSQKYRQTIAHCHFTCSSA